MSLKKIKQIFTYNIALDAHCLGEKKGGNETYILELIKHLPILLNQPNYTIYHTKKHNYTTPQNLNWSSLKIANPWLRNSLIFPYYLKKDKIDLIHFQYFCPPLCPAKVILSIHDLAWKQIPPLFSVKEKLYFSLIKLSLKRAQKIITAAQTIKNDILKYFPQITEDKIEVIPYGADHLLPYMEQAAQEESATIKKYNIPQDYLLFVSNLNPKKNFSFCIDTFSILKKEADFKNLKLIVVGNWCCPKYRSKIKHKIITQGLNQEIIFLNIPQHHPTELICLYKNARMLLYPSFYEGFGFPPLEALSCGTPCISSNTGALPEILEDSALLISPTDQKEFLQNIKALYNNTELKNKLISSGQQKIKKYKWTGTAQKTVQVYQQVLTETKKQI